jgi:quercetin dioxygenase-like cupin family protein
MAGEPIQQHEPRHGRMRAARIVQKPWGREISYANDELFGGRVLEITKDQTIMPSRHELLCETIYLLSGHVWFHLNGLEFDWPAGACLTLRPGDTYRLVAVEDSVVLEVSYPPLPR